MSSQLLDRSHPVTDFAARLRARLTDLTSVATWSMTPAQQRAALVDLATAKAQLAALELRVLAEAERCGAGDPEAAASAADWVAVETRQTRISTRSDLKLAQALDHHEVLATAMGVGAVNPPQARAIVKALDRLPVTGEFAVSRRAAAPG